MNAGEETRVHRAAQELIDAYGGVPVPPLTETHPDLDLDSAYDIQLAQVEIWKERGGRVAGHKVGLTSRAMQLALGVDQPDYGHLFDHMIHPDMTTLDHGGFLQPRVEPEIAFLLGRPLTGPGATVADGIRAVDAVVPALEIIDSRIEDWRIGLVDTIADNASSAAVVLGTHPTPLDAADLRLVGCNLLHNGAVAATGAGGAVLGSPLAALTWLANVLGARGIVLEAGSVVLPGSCTSAVSASPGDCFTAVFAGLGSVTVTFEDRAAGSETDQEHR